MLKVTISNSGFYAEGHADYAERGKDIVCASASAMTQMALIGLMEYNSISWHKYDGHLRVGVNYPDRDTEVILTTLKKAISQLEDEYPENIQLEEI